MRRVSKQDLTPYKREWERGQKRKDKHLAGAWSAFRKQHEALSERLLMEGLDASAMGVKGLGNWLRRQGDWDSWLETWVGPERAERRMRAWRGNLTKIMVKRLLGEVGPRGAKALVEKEIGKSVVPLLLWSDRAPMRERIPESLLSLLPPNLVVEVDPDGRIERVTSRFGNQTWNWAYKTEQLRRLVREYNRIVKRVKRDLGSQDPDTRMSAIITSIIMETGIRPSARGRGKIDKDTGLLIETFGAVTLKPEHIRFLREDFAEIEFRGKMQYEEGGRTNLARLRDPVLIKILQKTVEGARKGGFDQVFWKADGTPYDYVDLERYFRARFKDFNPTDFRKLRATEALLQDLQDQRDALQEEVASFAEQNQEDLAERAAERLAEAIREAQERAREALSHDEGSALKVTQSKYIDPGVLLRLFSTGQIANTMKEAILQGRETLEFNPRALMGERELRSLAASARRVASVWRQRHIVASDPKPPETLEDILRLLEDTPL